jgi:uncharacterized protein YndB with AHSA1/START domain
VHWRIKSGPEEWVGTDVTFELSQVGEDVLVLFGHRNWREAVEFTAHCSMKWATFLLSLKALVEFRLEKVAEGTLVTIVESGFDRVPAHRRERAFRMNEGGWAGQAENLKKYVEGT